MLICGLSDIHALFVPNGIIAQRADQQSLAQRTRYLRRRRRVRGGVDGDCLVDSIYLSDGLLIFGQCS